MIVSQTRETPAKCFFEKMIEININEIVKDYDLLKQQFQLLQSIAQKIRYLKKTFLCRAQLVIKIFLCCITF